MEMRKLMYGKIEKAYPLAGIDWQAMGKMLSEHVNVAGKWKSKSKYIYYIYFNALRGQCVALQAGLCVKTL